MRHVIRRLSVVLVGLVLVMALQPALVRGAFQRVRLFCGTVAQAGRAHGDVPVALTTGQAAGPYDVSVWATPEVGAAALYVVLVPRRGVPFVTPRSVRIALQPASGSEPERQYFAADERVRRGARFVAPVLLPRVDTWRARVIIDGADGTSDLPVTFDSVAPASMGLAAILIAIAPFLLVAGLWGPVRLVRRQHAALHVAAIPSS